MPTITTSSNRRLLEVLFDLHNKRESGVIRVERGTEKKQLVLNKGLLVFAESNVPEEHLVRIMVNMGLMPQAKVKEIASLMKAGKTSEEAVLASSGLGSQDLEKARREQATIITASLLGWTDCVMHFYPGEDLVRYQLNLGFSLSELLVLSARRAVSGHLIPVPQDFLKGTYSIVEDFAAKALDFPLSRVESYAYSLLHEPAKTEDLLSIIPLAEGKPEEVLLRLYALGLIAPKELVVKPGEASPPAATAVESNSQAQQLEEMLLLFETASLYGILSIPPEASPDQIQAAYHGLARQFHPDRFQSKEFSADIRGKAEKVFARLNEAYATLRDPALRAEYDAKRLTTESKVEAELSARSSGQDEKMAEEFFRDGRMLLAKGEFEKAVERLKGCVWLCPEKAAYQHYLGVAMAGIPNLRKSAEEHLLKAVEIDKLSTASRLELAKLYIKVNLRRKAELQLQELARWDPDNPEARKLFAELKRLESKKQ